MRTQVLQYIWSFIKNHPSVEDDMETLKTRLVEEIVSADSTCLTGVEERLINALSGFGGFAIQMDYESGMKYLITREIQMAINGIDDDELQDQIMDGMLPEPGPNRDIYKDFVREQRPSIFKVCQASSSYFNDKNRDADFFERLFDAAFSKFAL